MKRDSDFYRKKYLESLKKEYRYRKIKTYEKMCSEEREGWKRLKEDSDWLFYQNFDELQKRYNNRWIVIYNKKIVRNSRRLEELVELLDKRKKDFPNPLLHYYISQSIDLLAS